jgi:hypothetical protein
MNPEVDDEAVSDALSYGGDKSKKPPVHPAWDYLMDEDAADEIGDNEEYY